MPEATVSALVPVHAGVSSEHFAAALDSLLVQTRPVDEIVIVEDGPLPQAVIGLIEKCERQHRGVVRVRLELNQGAGVANQAGLEAAKGEWIAKADSDDISVPHRIEVQMEAVTRARADLCGAAMLEFVGTEDDVVSARSMPLTHQRIGVRMRWNNPVNHPTALYRRDVALAAGGYPTWRHMQDYGLVARMYAHGSCLMNLPDNLVMFRASSDVTGRRRSSTVRGLEWALQQELHRLSIVGGVRRYTNFAWRTSFRLLPPSAVDAVARKVLATPVGYTWVGARDPRPGGGSRGARRGHSRQANSDRQV